MTDSQNAYEFIEAGGYIEGRRIEGVDFSNMVEPRIRVLDSVFVDCTFVGTDFSKGQLSQVSFDTANAPQLHLHDSGLQDVEFVHSRLGAVAAYATSWKRSRFADSKIEFLNLRDSRLETVRFENCTISELDLTGAKLKGVTFVNCTIDRLVLTRTECKNVDLRGAKLASVTDFAGLKGTTMTMAQFIDLAPDFAAVLGVSLK